MSATQKKGFGGKVKPGSRQARMGRESARSPQRRDSFNFVAQNVDSGYHFITTATPSPHSLAEKNRKIKALEREIATLKEKLKLYERRSDSVSKVNEIKGHYLQQMVQSTEFGKALNCTRQNINRLRREHKILAVSGKNGNYYPIWQLDKSNKPYPCIARVIDTLGFDNQWTIVQFFHSRFELIDNKTPIEFLAGNPNDDLEIPKLARQYMAN